MFEIRGSVAFPFLRTTLPRSRHRSRRLVPVRQSSSRVPPSTATSDYIVTTSKSCIPRSWRGKRRLKADGQLAAGRWPERHRPPGGAAALATLPAPICIQDSGARASSSIVRQSARREVGGNRGSGLQKGADCSGLTVGRKGREGGNSCCNCCWTKCEAGRRDASRVYRIFGDWCFSGQTNWRGRVAWLSSVDRCRLSRKGSRPGSRMCCFARVSNVDGFCALWLQADGRPQQGAEGGRSASELGEECPVDSRSLVGSTSRGGVDERRARLGTREEMCALKATTGASVCM